MRGGPSAWARVRRLEGHGREVDVRRVAEAVAADLGIGVEEVLAGARDLADRLAAAGAVSFAERCRTVAAAGGLDPAEVHAEAERLMARLGR